MVFERFKRKKEDKTEYKFTDSLENELLFNNATECLQKEKSDEAIELFEKILETEPDNIHALNGKGSGLMQLDRLSEAEEVFNQSLSVKDNEMAYLNKAIIFGNTGNYEKAIEYCDKIMEMFPNLKDVVQGIRNTFIENMNKNDDTGIDGYDNGAQELINKADALKDENRIWDAWEAYEQAIKADASCENKIISRINELKTKLIQEFMFFDVTMKEDFNIQNEADMLKIKVMQQLLIDHDFTEALLATKQILTIKEEDIDALNYMGAISFYFDEVDEAIEYFEKVAENGDDIYLFYADFNKAFVLRRKSMITGDLDYMVQALDIFDEMLKDPVAYDKVKPHQREILDKLQEFMGVPLF